MSVPVMDVEDVEDVEQRARHEGAAKALRYMAEHFEAFIPLSATYVGVCERLRKQAEYHEGFLPGAAKRSARAEEAVALLRSLAESVQWHSQSFNRMWWALVTEARCYVTKWDKEDGT